MSDELRDKWRMIPGDSEAESASRPHGSEPYVERGESCGLPVADTALGPVYCQLNDGHDGPCQAWEWVAGSPIHP